MCLVRLGLPAATPRRRQAAWKCAARDTFLGWDRATRERNLQSLTDNTRFLIPAWVQVPLLASHALGLIARRLNYTIAGFRNIAESIGKAR